MGQQELLTLAKHGNERAIATLLNETLQQKGVTATCYRNGNYLQVVLVSAEVVEQSDSIHFIYDQLLRLKAASIRTVQVYGRQGDEQEHIWTEVFELSEPISCTPKRTPRHRKESLTPSFVRKGIRRLSFLGTRFKLSDRANLPQPIQTKPKTKILLLLLTSFSWILFPIWGSAVKSQLNTPIPTISNISKPIKLSASSSPEAQKPSTSKSSPKEKADSSSESNKSSKSKVSTKSSPKEKADSSSKAKKSSKSKSSPNKLDSSSSKVKKSSKSKSLRKKKRAAVTSAKTNKRTTAKSLRKKKRAAVTSAKTNKRITAKSLRKKKRAAVTSAKTNKRITAKSLRKKKQTATYSAIKKSSTPKSTSNSSAKKKIKITPSSVKKPSTLNSSPKTQPSPTSLPADNISTPKVSPSLQQKPTPTSLPSQKPLAPKSSTQEKQTPNTESATPILPSTPASKDDKNSITIKAVGDMVLGTNFPNNRLPQNNEILFKYVKSSLQGADILFGNFESTLTTHKNSAKDTSRPMVFAFRTPPIYANLLKKVGFDVLSVANNHSLDFSHVGFTDTIKNIEKVGIKPVGKKNQIVYLNVNNIPVAFIGFSFSDVHNSINNLPAAKALVAQAKKKADIVVISVHGGAEGTDAMRVKNKSEMFYGENRGNLVLFAHTLIDNGADLILGHGPHVARAMELYKGKMIAYSMGNFVGYRTLSTAGVLSNSMILETKLNSQGDFVSGKIIPVSLDKQGIPRIDKQSRVVKMVGNLTKSDFPKSLVSINKKGQIAKQFRTYRYFTLDFESTKNSKSKG